MSRARELLRAYKNPLEKYGDKFIDFELSLGEERENPLRIIEMFDTLPSVFDYYVSLEIYIEEERDRILEEYEVIDAQIYEHVEDILIKEKGLPKSRTPTREAIKSRAKIMFNKFMKFDSVVSNIDKIKLFYEKKIFYWMEDSIERTSYIDETWKLLIMFHKLYKELKKLNHYYNIIHGRTIALRMRKDTIVESGKLLKDVVVKGLALYDGGTRSKLGGYAELDENVELVVNGNSEEHSYE